MKTKINWLLEKPADQIQHILHQHDKSISIMKLHTWTGCKTEGDIANTSQKKWCVFFNYVHLLGHEHLYGFVLFCPFLFPGQA